MEQARHPRQQQLSGIRENGHDLLRRTRARLDLKMQYYGGMPRLADPRELGGAYVYLLSDGASYTTGIDIPVAGIVGAW